MGEQELKAANETLHLSFAFVPARAIYVAAKLGIADLIRETPLSAEELAQEVDADAGALFRILRGLVAIGLFRQGDDGFFWLSTRGHTLCSDSSESVRDYVILAHELPYKTFGNIMHCVRTGEPAYAETFGEPLFQHLKSDQDIAAVFHAGLVRVTP